VDGLITHRLVEGGAQASDLFEDQGRTVTVYLESWKGTKLLWLRSLSGRWYRVVDYSSLPPETAALWGYISIKATREPPISSVQLRNLRP
jgi:hypothetical protein